MTGDKASDAARPVLWKTPRTFVSCCSDENPKPNTVLALLSAHCPNFCDVLVKVMWGVIVLFIITCRKRAQRAETSALNETPQRLLTKSSVGKARTKRLKQPLHSGPSVLNSSSCGSSHAESDTQPR